MKHDEIRDAAETLREDGVEPTALLVNELAAASLIADAGQNEIGADDLDGIGVDSVQIIDMCSHGEIEKDHAILIGHDPMNHSAVSVDV